MKPSVLGTAEVHPSQIVIMDDTSVPGVSYSNTRGQGKDSMKVVCGYNPVYLDVTPHKLPTVCPLGCHGAGAHRHPLHPWCNVHRSMYIGMYMYTYIYMLYIYYKSRGSTHSPQEHGTGNPSTATAESWKVRAASRVKSTQFFPVLGASDEAWERPVSLHWHR